MAFWCQVAELERPWEKSRRVKLAQLRSLNRIV
jgi:hypothetical protein